MLWLSDRALLRYHKQTKYGAGMWKNGAPGRVSPIGTADDNGPPNGRSVMTYDQAAGAVMDLAEGLNPISGHSRREPNPEFWASVWEIAGALVAADVKGCGGFGFIWRNPADLVAQGARQWPIWLWLFELGDQAPTVRLAGKICRMHANGASLNADDSKATMEALEAAGESFTDLEYQLARSVFDGRYGALKAVVRELAGQFKSTKGSPLELKMYRIGPLIGLETCLETLDYAVLYDMADGVVPAGFAQSPSKRYSDLAPSPCAWPNK